ncbi:MAG: TIGR03619 family F420-dependent LLM class oxidoreductase [Proteobacteria bacterium]|nr:TIGR03619 family F420-dependent LLM class oxidoreductase [Pseudomonadota bacterium]
MAALNSFGLDVGIYGKLAMPEPIFTLAGLAEDMDFASIWVADHVAFPVSYASKYPYAKEGDFPSKLDDPLMEPIATLGVLAGATKRVKLGTAVLVMPMRHPLLQARQLVTIDQLSGGRLVLGAGVGWLEEEFAALGFHDFKRRGLATDESIDIFRAVAAGGEVGYKGQIYAFDPVFCSPPSAQRPHPPVLIGGVADPALKRVARLGDGWLAVSVTPERAAERIQKLRAFCTETGRSFADMRLAFKVFLNIGEPKQNADGGREPATGSISEIVDDLQRIRELGFGEIIVRVRGSASLDDTRRELDRFANEVAPKV